MDQEITRWLNAPAGNIPALDMAMLSITRFGVPLLILLVILQWWSRQDRLRVRHVCVAAGLSFLIGLGINQIILLFVHRLRPYDGGVSHLIVERSADWAFPSDHSTAAFAIAAAFLLHGLGRRGAAFLAIAVLVGLSRVYVGTHYVGDVVGGALTGLVGALLVRAVYWEGTRADRLITGIL
ncbi:MAG: phosphatase PAP2 family protein [Proteobacteria bacterium]|nr:phosphatase PAP2 family protein [Pseudomonadota bacterium]